MDIDKLKKILEIPAKFVDITIQESQENQIILRDGIAKDLTSGDAFGIGIRVLDNGWGFASTNSPENIDEITEKARKMAAIGEKIKYDERDPITDNVRVKSKVDPVNVDLEEKREILHRCEEAVREYKEVVSSTLAYIDSKSIFHYLNSEGSDIRSEYTRVGIFTTVYAKKNGKIQVGSERLGATGGLEYLKGAEEKSKKAAEKALRLLDAEEAPSGVFRVVLDPLLTGVFIHEALGHAMEADHVINGESILEGKLGSIIASSLVTVYDDPTIEGSFGFYFYDSEGVRGERKAVLEKGIFKRLLQSRETASKLGDTPTGNARSQNYSHFPIPRMSNTYVEKGDMSFEEMIEDIKYGVYLRGSKGGEVDTVRGVFQFSAEEGFIIRNGKLAEPIRDVALSGETLKILKNIDAVGNDELELHIGFCGKASQSVPVGDGGPHIRTTATVGGTK
jgi:TldD protein